MLVEMFLGGLDRLLRRVEVYRSTGLLKACAACGSSVRLRMPVVIYHPEKLCLGTGIDIGEFVLIRASGGVSIGSRVLIAAHAVITSRTHPKELPRFGVNVDASIVIEDDVWIGAGAVILPGVRIGRGAIIGAGAVVTKNVAAGEIVAGVPARFLGRVETKK